jgi:hypothetical protein
MSKSKYGQPSDNVETTLREAFEVYNPAVTTSENTDGKKWFESKVKGDIIQLDGNALAASYIVISKNPLEAGTESYIETVGRFEPSLEFMVGLHMSQRTLGQETSIELIDEATITPPSEIPISNVQQTTTTLTVNTVSAHGLIPGKRIGIYGSPDSRMNYPSLVVASIPSTTQFTCTAGPGGTIPSLTVGPFSGGNVYYRSGMSFAQNGSSIIFENVTATNLSAYVRSESGDMLPSGTALGNHALTSLSTASVVAASLPYTYAFQPTAEFRLKFQPNRIQWSNVAVDSVASETSVFNRTQVVPDSTKRYKLRIKARNNKALSIPVAKIVSAVKSASTTATIVTDVPHGLTVTDLITVYGIADQAATSFPNLTVATAVASVVDATTFTVIIGSSGTATSYGGYVSRVQGGNLPSALGALTMAIQNATLSNKILTLTGSASWSGIVIGDYVNVHGCRNVVNGGDMGVDGAYRVRNIVTTSLELEAIGLTVVPADFTITNCGGGVIKRTDTRISYVRLFDYDRQRVEIMARATSDLADAAAVSVNNVPSATVAGMAAHDAVVSGAPVRVGAKALTANTAAVATGDVADMISTLVGAIIQKPFSIPEADFYAAAPLGGILNTATPLIVKEAPGAGLRNYFTGIELFSEALTNATELILKDPDLTCSSQTISSNTLTTSASHLLAIGDQIVFTAITGATGFVINTTYYVLTIPSATTFTMSATRGGSTLAISGTITATLHRYLWRTKIPTGGLLGHSLIEFQSPLKGSINTAQSLQTITASGAGAVYANLCGFIAP